MTIDTLRYVENLERAKVPKAQARAHAKALTDHILADFATKHDLDRLLLKMTGINLAIMALGVTVLTLILK